MEASLPFLYPSGGFKVKQEREYLTWKEVEALLEIARKDNGSNGHRNYTIILLMFRHGLRATEVCNLTWNAVNYEQATIAIRRLKNGNDSVQPLQGDEMRALRKQQRDNGGRLYIFPSQGYDVITRQGVSKIFTKYELQWQKKTGCTLKLHPHMMRHSCGFHLANKGIDIRRIQDYLGHKSITHTVLYTQLSSKKFEGIWD